MLPSSQSLSLRQYCQGFVFDVVAVVGMTAVAIIDVFADVSDTGDGIIKVPQGPYGPIWGPIWAHMGPIRAHMGPYGPCGILIIPSTVDRH